MPAFFCVIFRFFIFFCYFLNIFFSLINSSDDGSARLNSPGAKRGLGEGKVWVPWGCWVG